MDAEFKQIFMEEAEDLLKLLNDSLLTLEKNPENLKMVDNLFRAAHTLKSSAAAMGYNRISELSHEMEDVLEMMRQKQVAVDPEVINVLFECLDTLEDLVKSVSKDEEKEVDLSNHLNKLRGLLTENPQEERVEGKEKAEGRLQESRIEEPPTITPIESVRVAVKRLDDLMDLVEELSVSRLRLEHVQKKYGIKEMEEVSSSVSRLVSDLQYSVMKARMIPVEQIFSRYPRMMRDLSKLEHKEVNLEIEGRDIEVDRSILDKIAEPIVHLLRNAVTHGVETPAERETNGKPREGTIQIAVRQEQNYTVVKVSDDGRGIDPNAIRRSAIRRGVLTETEATQLEDRDAIELIFNPNFSTSEKVTTISGRGVGMSVVKTQTESIGGMVDVESVVGTGTEVTLRLPLTLATIQALLLRLGAQTYAIPLSDVIRMIRAKPEDIRSIQHQEILILQKEQIPLLRLQDMFQIPDGREEEFDVVIVERSGRKVGLTVDEVIDRQEITIKPLDKMLRGATGFAGTTILGNGRAAIILDSAALIDQCGNRQI